MKEEIRNKLIDKAIHLGWLYEQQGDRPSKVKKYLAIINRLRKNVQRP